MSAPRPRVAAACVAALLLGAAAAAQDPASRRLDREPDLGGGRRPDPEVDDPGEAPSPIVAPPTRDYATEHAVAAEEMRERGTPRGRPSEGERLRGAAVAVLLAGFVLVLALASRLLRARRP